MTPPTATILEGITRDSIISLANRAGLAVHERVVSRDQFYVADELFVCGTAADVVAIREVDHRQIGTGKAGPVTLTLQREYRSLTVAAIRCRHAGSIRSMADCPSRASPIATIITQNWAMDTASEEAQ